MTGRQSPSPADRVLLEGPHSRRRELWLVLRTVRDFIRGFRVLHFVGPCVTVFGSARFGPDHPHYATGRQVGAALARVGFTVMTGGGPGTSTYVLVYYIYQQAFKLYEFGYASAIAFILFFIVLALTLVQWSVRKRWVHHEQ